MPNLISVAAVEGSTGTLSGVITEEMMSGVLDEVISLLPVCMPTMITFMGIRKGIGFVRSILKSA